MIALEVLKRVVEALSHSAINPTQEALLARDLRAVAQELCEHPALQASLSVPDSLQALGKALLKVTPRGTCDTCRYHHEGECRRSPPSAGGFPHTNTTWWCGAWGAP
jgi:hypothetical protein